MNYLISLYILISLFICLVKKKDAYIAFSDGVSSGINISLKMFKVLFCFTILIECINNCGIIEDVSNYFSNDFINIILGMIIRPFSSSSSMALMLDSFKVAGVDSLESIVLSLIYCCCDSYIYVLILYFSYLDIKNIKSIKYGIFINVVSYILILVFVFVFF